MGYFKLTSSLPEQCSPGKRVPEESAPGKRVPEESAPGKRAPEESAPGESAPGKRAPEESAPGKRAPVEIFPGERDPRHSPEPTSVALLAPLRAFWPFFDLCTGPRDILLILVVTTNFAFAVYFLQYVNYSTNNSID